MHVGLGELARQKELSGGQERTRIHRVTMSGEWFSGGRRHIRDALSVKEVVGELTERYQRRIEYTSYFCSFQQNMFPQKSFSTKGFSTK